MTRLRFLGVAHRNTNGDMDAAGVYGIDGPAPDDWVCGFCHGDPDGCDWCAHLTETNCPNCPAGQMPYGADQCPTCDDADAEEARTCRNCGLVEDDPNHNGLCRDCDHSADYLGGYIRRRIA